MHDAPQTALTIKSVERTDVQRAGEVLASAFRDDPFFLYCVSDPEAYQRIAPRMFPSLVRRAMIYGKAWATRDLNAVALRLPLGARRIGFWAALRSGLVSTFLLMDNATRRRFGRAFPIVEETHKRIMGDQPHWYCWMMGVMPACQGAGVGRRLMRHTFEQTDRAGLPCYLETFSESSVRVHEGQMYSIRQTVRVPGTPLTLYAMVRPPQ
jgi:GNAT superfamily N-acetyltransferase